MNKKIAVALTIMTAAVISLTAGSYASEWRGPADTLAAITGKTVEDGEGTGLQDGSGGQLRGGMNGGGLGQGRGRAGK